jgi:hypothetical protein
MENGSKTRQIIAREWYDNGRVRTSQVTDSEYRADMFCNSNLGETVHVWEGQDRNGTPLRVIWLPSPRFGPAAFYAYEISNGGE